MADSQPRSRAPWERDHGGTRKLEFGGEWGLRNDGSRNP
jgi:hypothetical protein